MQQLLIVSYVDESHRSADPDYADPGLIQKV